MSDAKPARWWSADIQSQDRWRFVLDYVRAIETAQSKMVDRWVKYTWLYDRNARVLGVGGKMRSMAEGDPTTENICRNNVETATSLLGNEATRAAALTDGAEWSVQRKAKRLERFLEAQFKRLDWDALQVRMVRAGCITGNGYLKFYIEGGAICADYVPSGEIIVDDESCMGGMPLQMAQRRFVDKDVLKERFPKFATQIDTAHTRDSTWTFSRLIPPTQIAVVESYRRGPKGRHTMSIEGATLVDEPWTRDWFPYLTFRWVERPSGFYGCGLVEELVPYQLLVNKTNRNIQLSHDLFGNQRMFVHQQDALLQSKLDDVPENVYIYAKTPPTVPNWQAVKPEVYNYKEGLKSDAQRYSGVPDTAARSLKPVGLDSGAALREWTDIQASRLTSQKAAIERLKLEAAKMLIALAKELYGRGQDVKAFWNSRNLAKKIKWSEVDLDEDMYVLRIEPASMMSRTPAAMRQAVIDLAQTGALSSAEVLRLAGVPDVQRALDIATAALEDIEAEIEELYDGTWRAPEPFMDLVNGIPRMQSAYLKARRDGAPPEVLNLIQMWIVKAKAMKDLAEQPQSPQQNAVPWQAGLAAPAGAPGTTPGGAAPMNGMAPTAPPAAA